MPVKCDISQRNYFGFVSGPAEDSEPSAQKHAQGLGPQGCRGSSMAPV